MPASRLPLALLAALAIAAVPPGAAAENPEAARLSASESPFVRRHADDPVQWLPWGPEAFEKARNEKKPLFVSVGYDSCHWCARMQQETFSDPAIAAVLNKHFVNVLVDRVQRPDLDGLYMTYLSNVQSGGGGGWPVNVWLTPEGIPFSAGGYFPPAPDATGLPAFSKVVEHITSQWTRFPDYIDGQSKRDFAKLQEHLDAADKPSTSTEAPPTPRDLAMAAYEFVSSSFDPVAGGFTHPAKFPQGPNLRFLVHLAAGEPEDSFKRRQILKMLTLSARSLVGGGVFDHIDGGFHRYAIDPAWQLPRFEKTLPGQHEVVSALLDLHTLAPDPLYAEAIRRTLDFTTRFLRLPSGLFQSALHSDSKSTPDDTTLTEGAAYTWTYDDFAAAVGPEDLPVLADAFQIRPGGNLSPGTSENPDLARVNIPRRRSDAPGHAETPEPGEAERAATIARGLGKLAEARARRPRPDPDTTAVTGWNALAASAFAKAYQAFGDATDLKTAETCAEALLSTRFDPASGNLVHLEHPRGEVLAFSYSATIRALLDLYDATLEPRHVETAAALQDRQIEFFWDRDRGGFFETLADSPQMLIRLKRLGNDPDAGTNDLAAANLRRLGDLLGNPAHLERSAAVLDFALPQLRKRPGLAPDLLVNALVLEREPTQVLINAPLDSELAAATLRLLRSRPRERLTVFAIDSRNAGAGFLAARNSPLRDAEAKAGSPPSVLLGRGFRFGPPLTSPEAVEKALASP